MKNNATSDAHEKGPASEILFVAAPPLRAVTPCILSTITLLTRPSEALRADIFWGVSS